jgi:hypothetical protein
MNRTMIPEINGAIHKLIGTLQRLNVGCGEE